jgi:hypothetical protein
VGSGQTPRAVYVERFWSRVPTTGDCREWQGGKGHWGYGLFVAKSLIREMGYKEQLAHRWAWIFTNGPIPKGMSVLHSCDNPPCVRIDHLRLGTHADNANDRKVRGRNNSPRGAATSLTPLTDEDVRLIRSLYLAGSREFGGHALARRFGVSQPTIWNIVNRVTWAWLDANEDAA